MILYENEVTKYHPRTRDGGLVLNFRLKAEASGYPGWVGNPEGQERYVETFYAGEGVRLDRDALRPNAAKQGLVKLCWISLWGNWQKDNIKPRTS